MADLTMICKVRQCGVDLAYQQVLTVIKSRDSHAQSLLPLGAMRKSYVGIFLVASPFAPAHFSLKDAFRLNRSIKNR